MKVNPKEYVSEFYKESDVVQAIAMIESLGASVERVMEDDDNDDNIMLGGLILTEDDKNEAQALSLKQITQHPMSMTLDVVFVGCVIDAKTGKKEGLGVIFEIPVFDDTIGDKREYGYEIWTVKNPDKLDEKRHPYAEYNRRYTEFVHCETGFSEYTRATAECKIFATSLYEHEDDGKN